MSRRIADLLVHFMPANIHKYSVPNVGADALAAKRLLETVAWDYESHVKLSQSCIHDMWHAFTEVTQQPEDWRYFAQRGCFKLFIKDYTSKVEAAMSRESLPLSKSLALMGRPASGLPDSDPYTHVLGEQYNV